MNISRFSFRTKQGWRVTHLLCKGLLLVMLISSFALFAPSANAAGSEIRFNISSDPCTGNLSSCALPSSASELKQGNSYYINMAATKDFKFDLYELYVKVPGQSGYSLVNSYDPSGYFRWYYIQYRFSKEGTYYIMPIITTTDGAQYSGEFSYRVKGNSSESTTPENTPQKKSGIQLNISQSPCTGNLSLCALPAAASELKQGSLYYINMAATEDFKFDRYELYVKVPGQSGYSLVDSYDPSGYFRWYCSQYRFAESGTYYIKPVITTKTGTQYSGEYSYQVTGTSAPNGSAENTYQYGSQIFAVVPNFNSAYFFNQNNYSRFVNSKGNRGCTATAMCIAYSIYHNTPLSPNDVKWSSGGTSWEYCTRYTENGKTYWGGSFNQDEALKCIFNCINSGKPIIVGVTGAGCDHVVTAVGIRDGADRNSLSLGDILIIDPYGGVVSTLAKYTGIDCWWSLRIPID